MKKSKKSSNLIAIMFHDMAPQVIQGDLMHKKNILVTGTGGRAIGSGILHSLLRTGVEVRARWNVIATDADPFSWGLYKVDYGELLPIATHPDYIPQLNKLIEKHKIDAIIPGTQIEGELILNHTDELYPVHVIANRKELYPLMMNKVLINEALKKLGINYIETAPLSTWRTVVEKYGFPIIVKPTKKTGGSRRLYIIGGVDELELVLPFVDAESAPSVQPYIGSGEDEYTVGALTDKNGVLIDSIVMKRKLMGLSLLESRKIKNKTYSVSTGYSQGYIIKNDKIQTFCENLALGLESKGPLNIQLRLCGDQIYVFEIHPRFSGTTPIRADVGFNEVDILLRNYLFDEKFSRLNYRYNVAAIRAFEHVIVPLNNMKSSIF